MLVYLKASPFKIEQVPVKAAVNAIARISDTRRKTSDDTIRYAS